MPIKGLQTDQPGLPRAGVIRLGYKVDTGRKDKHGNPLMRPVEADHFVLTDAPGVTEILGTDKPAQLEIFFPFDDTNLVFPAFMQFWQASSLVCRGDGEQIVYAIDSITGKAVVRDGVALADHYEGKQQYKAGERMTCPGVNRDQYPKCLNCKPNAMLIVLLRKVPRLAYYQIATTSIHNIVELTQQLNTCMDNLEKITGQRRLVGVPFILKRVVREISAPKKDGGRQRVKKHLLQLEIDPDWVMRMFTAQRQLADPLRLALPRPQPPAPRVEIVEEGPLTEGVPFGFADQPAWEPLAEDIEVEPEEDAPAPTEPPHVNGNGKSKLPRPMSPKQVKDAMAVKAARSAGPPSEQQLDYAASSLSKACEGDDAKRHSVTLYLFGKESMKDLTGGECSAIIDWIGAKAENEYLPDDNAIKEIEAIIADCQREQGQVDMFADKEEIPF